MIKKILVALSGTPFTPAAIKYAVDLARLHRAELTGVTIVDPQRIESVGPVPIGGASAAHVLVEHRRTVTRERIEEEVDRFDAACREADLPFTLERETGDTLETLTALWRYHDFTVFGLRSLFEYGVVDNPDDEVIKLIAKGVRPLLAVSETHRPVRRVLIAYNGSMESAKAMKQFVQLNPWPDVRARIVTFGIDDETATQLLADAAGYLHAHGINAETENMPDAPIDGLLSHAADWESDLIVMGSTARHKIFRLILGDTALHAMQNSTLPLFLAQ